MSNTTDLEDTVFFFDDDVNLTIFRGSPRLKTDRIVELNPGTQLDFIFKKREGQSGNGFGFDLQFYNDPQDKTSNLIHPNPASDDPLLPENLPRGVNLNLSLREAAEQEFKETLKYSAFGKANPVTKSAYVRVRALEELLDSYDCSVEVGRTEIRLVLSRADRDKFRIPFDIMAIPRSDLESFLDLG